MFDAHCHLDRLSDPSSALVAARAAGVVDVLVAGVDPGGWDSQERLAGVAGVHLAYGLHPTAVDADASRTEAALRGLPTRLRGAGVVALGETGLDHRPAYRGHADAQRLVFRAQLDLARQLDLPVVLHVVAAYGAAWDVLKQDGLPRAGGMVHAWSGAADLVPRWQELGLYLSFGGPLTWPGAHRVLQAAQACDEALLLVETDAPDQPPEPLRVARQEGQAIEHAPAYLGLVVAALARARGCSDDHIGQLCAHNARRLFGLPPREVHHG
jgi:TatD DNase family protein